MPALGRRIEHDPRSRAFPARRAAQPRSVLWSHRAPVLDQGDLGACVGFATAQLVNTSRFVRVRPSRHFLGYGTAVELYQRATRLDQFPGEFPPEDTGSSGLGGAKAGVELGYFGSYRHAFGFDDFLAALALGPLLVGTWWYSSMFTPDEHGYVEPTGSKAGGHEYLVLGSALRDQRLTFLNSWSSRWGRNGRFYMSFDAFRELLADDGDATQPIARS